MEHEDLEFDDPVLKGAVRRVWGDDRAPQRLRGRISHLLATAGSRDEDAPLTPANRWQRWSGRVYGAAVAAVLLLGIGLLVLHYQGAFDRAVGASYARGGVIVPTKTEVPLSLAQAMLVTHASCGSLHDHRLIHDPSITSYSALNVKLTADLGFPVLARDIGGEWKFAGAGTCDVGGLRASHLVFRQGNQTVSLFSLPAHCAAGVAPGGIFEGTVDNRPVAGFARPGTLYALVGSSSTGTLPLASLTAIRDGLFTQFDVGCGADSSELDLFE